MEGTFSLGYSTISDFPGIPTGILRRYAIGGGFPVGHIFVGPPAAEDLSHHPSRVGAKISGTASNIFGTANAIRPMKKVVLVTTDLWTWTVQFSLARADSMSGEHSESRPSTLWPMFTVSTIAPRYS